MRGTPRRAKKGDYPYEGARNVIVGDNVIIGKNVAIYENVTIERDSHIGHQTTIGEPLPESYYKKDYVNPPTLIRRGALIRSGTIIYSGCDLGENLTTGHYAFIRERTTCGGRCSFGTFCACDGDVRIGERCRFHYSTFISKKTTIGDDVWLFPHAQLYDDLHPPCGLCLQGPTICDRVVVGAGAIILPGVRLEKDAVVAAGSVVTKDVPEGAMVAGIPARIIGKADAVKCRHGRVDAPYPWTKHYLREERLR